MVEAALLIESARGASASETRRESEVNHAPGDVMSSSMADTRLPPSSRTVAAQEKEDSMMREDC
jgi:hypothetical protein